MNKDEYIKRLEYRLRRLPKEEYDKAISYFTEYFEEAGPENEIQATQDLGTPEMAADQTGQGRKARHFGAMDRNPRSLRSANRPSGRVDAGRPGPNVHSDHLHTGTFRVRSDHIRGRDRNSLHRRRSLHALYFVRERRLHSGTWINRSWTRNLTGHRLYQPWKMRHASDHPPFCRNCGKESASK